MNMSMTYAYFALSGLFVMALATRLAWPRISRHLGSVPTDDQAAIDLFLANRNETAITVKKEIWAGGPEGRFASANIYGLPHQGRFYHVFAQDAGGARYRHELAATGGQKQSDLALFQQGSGGFWTKVLQ
jgi:hypothetical protein